MANFESGSYHLGIRYFLPFFDISFFYGRVFSGPKVADASHECSWLTVSPVPCGGRPLWYGVTWSLLRWVNDHFGPSFPGGERAIQKGWSTTISGVWRASRMSSACR